MLAVAKRETTKRPGVFGMNLLRLRNAKRLSQAELALRSGVARITIGRLETGYHEGPDAKTGPALAKALGVQESELYRSTDAQESPATQGAGPAMTAEQFMAAHRELTGHEQAIITNYGRSRPGAVQGWTEQDWLHLVRIIREEFPPKIG